MTLGVSIAVEHILSKKHRLQGHTFDPKIDTQQSFNANKEIKLRQISAEWFFSDNT